MLSAFPKSRQAGFTLIELMIGVVILGILSAVALPSFQSWMRNAQVRNAAESIINGLQRARSEAVSRNTNVAFVLGVGTSWSIGVVNPASAVESRSSNEGSKDVTVIVFPLNATTITFNNFGGIVTDPARLTQVDLAATGSNKNLRVTIGVGGNARMCDPNQPSTSVSAC